MATARPCSGAQNKQPNRSNRNNATSQHIVGHVCSRHHVLYRLSRIPVQSFQTAREPLPFYDYTANTSHPHLIPSGSPQNICRSCKGVGGLLDLLDTRFHLPSTFSRMPAALEKSNADMRSSASSSPSTAHSSSVSVSAPPFAPRDLHGGQGTTVKKIPRYYRACRMGCQARFAHIVTLSV